MNDRRIIMLNPDDILPNRFQPRIRFDEQATMELANSIKEHGIIQPIVVRPVADKYEIIAGERRYKASILAGLKNIPCIVTEFNDSDSAEIALIENVQRQELTPIEEAISYKKILDMGYTTQEQLAKKIGCTQSTIANKLRLLNLEDEVQEALLDGKISERHARSLLKLENRKMQVNMLNKIIEERLTVRRTDEEIKKMLENNENVVSQEPHEDVEIIDFDDTPVKLNQTVEEVPLKTEEEIENLINLNAIENNAEDIYTEEPVANLEKVLTPIEETEQPVTEEKPYTVVEENNIEPPQGKFFNIFEAENTNNEQPEQENEQLPFIEEPESNNIFNVDVKENEANPVEEIKAFDLSSEYEQPEETKEESYMEEVKPFDLSNMYEDTTTENNVEPTYQNEIKEEETIKISSASTMRDVINMIRNCADTIEKNGFNIDVEEIDFEDMYQVIFKIDKK